MTTPSAPASGDDWVGVSDAVLPVAVAGEWAVLPSCGAVVSFAGTSRDHAQVPAGAAGGGHAAEVREGVTMLEYEAYEEHVVPRLQDIAAELRRRWPQLGRVVLLHRLGPVAVGEASVLVVVSAPHRVEAFAAAAFGIDAVKATAPIWKRETWDGGQDYGLDAHPVTDLTELAGGPATAGLTAAVPPSDPVSPCRT